jgi:hypothetical protein
MPDNSIENLNIRIDILQEKVWTNEENISRHIEWIANQESDLQKLKVIVKNNQKKLTQLENALHNKRKQKGGAI